MKKAHKKAKPAATRAAGDAAVPVVLSSSGLRGWGANGYQGAEFSTKRGYVYFPQLDTRREVDHYTRTELLRRARFLYANVGLARRLINGLSRMVAGTGMIPQAITGDAEWNQLASDAFARRAESAATWDVGGRYDFYSSQRAKLRCRYKDGDVLEAFTSSLTGRARFALYESHQVRDVDVKQKQAERWFDGVFCDRWNRALKYRVAGAADEYTDVLAEDCVFLADYERPGQSRGLTVLYHAVNNLIDTTEIAGWLKAGVKASNQFGYYLEAKDANTPRGMEAVFGGRKTTNGTSTTDATEQVDYEKVFEGGGRVVDVGHRELKVLQDDRPHPNTLGFLDYLVRDIAWGCGVAPEVLWCIDKLGGANSRFVLADAQGYISEQQDELVSRVLVREWNYTIAKEIKYGGLREPSTGPGTWMGRVRFTPPARTTVDFGRDGKLMLEMIAQGAMCTEAFYEMNGHDGREQTTRQLDFLAWRRDEALKRGFASDPLALHAGGQRAAVDDEEEEEEDLGDGGQRAEDGEEEGERSN